MAFNDWQTLDKSSKSGGQGEVRKVIHRSTGAIGALKQLHPNNMKSSERRYRFFNEVGALKVLDGDGVPRFLDASESHWEDPDTPLYLVMEWIEGPTLAQEINGNPTTIDNAISASLRISHILERCHALPIYHRDLKPDNIVLRGRNWSDPVLVDFGMSWAKAPDDESDFKTPKGQEIGNRFLRLPEHRIGGNHHDSRSDISMEVGLVFYMLCAKYPRSLEDELGQRPHEVYADSFPQTILGDARWSRIRRFFSVGFHPRLEARFQNISELQKWIKLIDDDTMSKAYDKLDEEIARLNDVLESAQARRIDEAAPAMTQANQAFLHDFGEIVRGAGLQMAGQNPVFKNRGAINEFYMVVSRRGTLEPFVYFQHRIALENEAFVASIRLERLINSEDHWQQYFSGPAADSEGLLQAAKGFVRTASAEVIRHLVTKFQ